MDCIAHRVRALNSAFFENADLGAFDPALLEEPRPLDAAALPDGRTWVRVYADGSALDDRGQVHAHACNAAREMRQFAPPDLLAA